MCRDRIKGVFVKYFIRNGRLLYGQAETPKQKDAEKPRVSTSTKNSLAHDMADGRPQMTETPLPFS